MEKVDDCKETVESVVRNEESGTKFAPMKRTAKRRWTCNASHWQAVEIAVLVIIIIVVWGLFALPTVFYLLHTSEKKVSSTAVAETKCTPVHYAPSQSVCLPLLKEYKKCIPATSAQDGIYISSKVDLQESENAVLKIKSFESFLSPQCRAVALPFACLYFFPLCDGNQTAYFLPSSDECISISTETCKGEWEGAKKLVRQIPDCRTLPDVSRCKVSIVNTSSLTSANSLFALIGFAGAKSLYCTAPDWTASLNSSTPFCEISGTVLFYGLMQIAFIWVCHVCFIFWSVKFPISFMQFKSHKNMKFLHAVVICLMVVVPVIPVAAVFGTGGFINARFPPLLCLPKNNDAAFYGLLFPMSILLASGVSLMIGVFWTIRKRIKNKSMPGSADKKVFIVFCYYVILGVVSLVAFELNSKTSTQFISSLATYFACERETPGKCESYRKIAINFTYPGISDAMYIILALYPLVNLVYAFDFHGFKYACSSFLQPSQVSSPIIGKKSKLRLELHE
ncbi:hypothetical protein EMCRGX_G017005 [Ephydatia muelleri]